jgi:hypothetical protein
MATAKTSPDYDPIEEAFKSGFKGGQSKEREYRSTYVERARRGGERRGGAKVTQAVKQERSALAKREAQRRGRRAAQREEQVASARRGAYRAGAADAKREAARLTQARPAPRQPARRSSARPAPLSAPNLAPPSLGLSGMDRGAASRIIIIMVVLTAGASIAKSAQTSAKVGPTVLQTSGGTIKVPSNLRAFGATMIIGVVSLIVAEINPGAGVVLMLAFSIAVFADLFAGGGAINKLSTNLLGARSLQTTTIPTTGQVGAPSSPNSPRGTPGAIGGGLGGGAPRKAS